LLRVELVGFIEDEDGDAAAFLDRPESDRDSVLPDLAVWEVYVIYGNSAAP